jgi:hypothetical protein
MINTPMNDTIFAAWVEIVSQPSLSRRTTSGSADVEELGRIGSPEGAKPRI